MLANNSDKGIGIDIVEVQRIQDKMKDDNGFKQYVFSEAEIQYCERNTIRKYEHYAGRFAAKEALSKALGVGIFGGFGLKNISVLNHENGAPYFDFTNDARLFLEGLGIKHIHLSISHIKSTAIAMVMVEK
jgi:holo-[acyl-carrier protein] synthase